MRYWLELALASTPFISCFQLEVLETGAPFRFRLHPQMQWGESEAAAHYSSAVLIGVLDHLGSLPLMVASNAFIPMATLSYAGQLGPAAPLIDPVEFEVDVGMLGETVRHCNVAVHSHNQLCMQGGLSFIAGALPGTVPSMMEPETSASDTKQPQIEQQTEWQPADDTYNPQAQHFGQWLQLQTVQPIGPDTDTQHWQTHAAYGEHLIGSRTFPALHGGATAAFLIQSALELAHSMGYPVLANFAIDYLRSGKPEPVELTLTTLHRSRRAWTVSVRLLQQEQKRLVAQAQLHFTSSL